MLKSSWIPLDTNVDWYEGMKVSDFGANLVEHWTVWEKHVKISVTTWQNETKLDTMLIAMKE